MTDTDYRHMANEIRDVIPLILHPQAIADLRLLADRYERLAEYLEVGHRVDCQTRRSRLGARPAENN